MEYKDIKPKLVQLVPGDVFTTCGLKSKEIIELINLGWVPLSTPKLKENNMMQWCHKDYILKYGLEYMVERNPLQL